MRFVLKTLLCVGAFAYCQITAANIASASPSDDKALMAANADFYAALNSIFKGKTTPMEDVWSHRHDVSYMGPDGLRLLGWDAVRADWNLQASKILGGTVELAQVNVQPGDTLSAISGIEVGENVVGGKPQKVSIRATNIFRKEDGKWKMIAHHTDKLPYLEK